MKDKDTHPELSKTKRKHEMAHYQKVGESLIQLKDSDLDSFELDDGLRHAIDQAKRFKSHEALRRQKQYIGKLMRNANIEAIEERLHEMQCPHEQLTTDFKQLEQWRERLIEGNNTDIHALSETYPTVDKQKLRQLIKRSKKERSENAPPLAQRKLFKLLREAHESQTETTSNTEE